MWRMDYSDLKMQVGETLQLQPRDGEDSRRLQVRLIGYLPGASLLVTTPKVGDKVMFSKYGYDEITIADTEYYVIPENSILGTF